MNLILANLFGLSINNLTSAIAQTAAHKYASAAQACASAALYDTPYTDQIAETWGETATKFAQLSATYADLAVTHARKVAEETANAVTDESAPLANRLVPLTAKLADLAEHLAEANASTADSHSTRLAADLDRLRTIERDWISDRNPSTTSRSPKPALTWLRSGASLPNKPWCLPKAGPSLPTKVFRGRGEAATRQWVPRLGRGLEIFHPRRHHS